MAKLLVHEINGIREFDLVDSEVRIGRELDNTLRLSDPSISRHHAILRRLPHGYEIQDLHSSNGVLINGNRLPLVLLRDNDHITLGQVHLTFSDPEPAEMPHIPAPTFPPPPPSHTPALPTTPIAIHNALAAQHAVQNLNVEESIPSLPGDRSIGSGMRAYQESTGKILQKTPAKLPARHPHRSAEHKNPAPKLLRPWLPPVPDLAKPTGERGDFISRLMAFLLDSLPFVLLPAAIFSLGFVVPKVKLILGVLMGMGVLVFVVAVLAYGTFLVWCWRHFGASPGKKLMKLRIVPEDDPDGFIDIHTAVLRAAGHFINVMLLMLPYLMLFRQERRGIQDILSKSLVIKVDR